MCFSYRQNDPKYLPKLRGSFLRLVSGKPKIIYRASILAAISCLIISLICRKSESSTNTLKIVFSGFTSPLLNLSTTAWTNIVVSVGNAENFTLSIICLCLSYKSLLSDKNCAKCILALAIGSELAGLVMDPNVPPIGINKNWIL